ncbi:MAG: energy-coupling factor transporter transmembrane component T [Oscillospiraceae bacterium]|nr:energy-coupling factor transporter transmembrane component T [Oscillospiraceae bacterium]
MSEKLQVRRPVYPLIGLTASVIIIVTGLIRSSDASSLWFLGAMWLLFVFFGYWRACLAVIPAALVMSAVMSSVTYAISGDISSALASVCRISTLCTAVIPGLALSPIMLVRSFSGIKLPRMLTLGMMITLTFFPLLRCEVKQVHEAMKTRGAGSMIRPGIFYRAFLIPLIVRLVSISDTLSLSVETRGFTAQNFSVYKSVKPVAADYIFLIVVAAVAGLAVAL